MNVQPVPREVFYSYAHEDEVLCNELEKHLSTLHRQGLISSWHDRQIVAGTDWALTIDTHLETASLILLLVSSDFLASDYCYGIEMKRALERHQMNEARVIPILLRPVEWHGAPFESLQVLPTNTQPVTLWSNQDEAFANIATGIRRAIEDLPQGAVARSEETSNIPMYPSAMPQYGVFLSSTNDPEVQKYRLAAKAIIESEKFRYRWIPIEMDEFTPSTSLSLERCRALVLSCHVYISILGPFYGTLNEEVNLSYSEYAYNVALESSKEIAIFLLPNSILNDSQPEIILQQGSLLSRQQEFKTRVTLSHMTRSVADLETFKHHFRRYLSTLHLLPNRETLVLRNEDWKFAPNVPLFFGRTEELVTLHQWIVRDRCRIVTIAGIGGIGKTNLTIKAAQRIRGEFEYVIWRSLLNALPITEILADVIRFLSDQQGTKLPETIDEQISLLLQYLQNRRCLLILDNMDAILTSSEQSGQYYKEGYEGYGELLKRVGMTPHHSCLLLNSREKPPDVASQEGRTRPVRTLELRGLSEADGRKIFDEIGSFTGSEKEWKELLDLYDGNPFALQLAARHVQEVFFGSISMFLHDGKLLFDGIHDLLNWHFNRLSELEKEVLYWLAIDREPLSLANLEGDVLTSVSQRALPSTLQMIQRRVPLEKVSSRYTLQPVLMEYVSDELIERVFEEIRSGKFILLRRHALLKALAPDYVREVQVRLILKPLLGRLLESMVDQANLELVLRQFLAELRAVSEPEPSYCGGNILNLLCQLGSELVDINFSGLSIRQAFLQNVELHNVDFSYSNLKQCVFMQTFGPISSHAFSPDGKLLATSESNGNINVWRVEDLQLLLTLRGHINWIFALAFSPNGQTLASGGEDKTVRLWDISSGECRRILHDHTNSLWAVAFSPNGRMLATGGEDHVINVWNPGNGHLLAKLRGHSQKVFSLDFSPDGQLLASASADNTIKIWDVAGWNEAATLIGHEDTVRGVTFSPDNLYLASGSWDRSIKIWDVQTRECKRILRGHDASVHSIAFSPSGQILASSDEDGMIRVWNVQSGVCLETLQGHVGEVWKVAFSQDGQTLASGGYDGTLRLWDTLAWKCRNTLQGFIDWVQALALSPNGDIVAGSNGDLTIRIWSAKSSKCVQTLRGHTGWAFAVVFSPDGKKFASGSDDRTIKIWDTHNWTCQSVFEEHTGWVQAIAFSPNSQLLASGSDDRTVKVWDVLNGRCIQTLQGHSEGIWSVVFCPDGETVLSGSEDSTIKAWNIHSGECIRTYKGHTDRVHSVALSPNGHMMASCSDDKTVMIWDFRSGKRLSVLNGHTSWVMSSAFSPTEWLVASGSKDGTVRIWDIHSVLGLYHYGRCRNVLEGHRGGVWSVTFSHDGKTVASASEDGSVRIWDVRNGRCLQILRQLRPYEGTSIAGASGLTDAQKMSLKVLGAVE